MSLEMQFFSWMMSSKRRNGTDTDLKRLQEEFEAEFSRPKVRIRSCLLVVNFCKYPQRSCEMDGLDGFYKRSNYVTLSISKSNQLFQYEILIGLSYRTYVAPTVCNMFSVATIQR